MMIRTSVIYYSEISRNNASVKLLDDSNDDLDNFITYTDIEYLDEPELQAPGSECLNEIRLKHNMIHISEMSNMLSPDEQTIYWLSEIAKKQDVMISLLNNFDLLCKIKIRIYRNVRNIFLQNMDTIFSYLNKHMYSQFTIWISRSRPF